MKTTLLGFLGLSATLASMAVHAQTYDLDIVMSQKGVPSFDFVGSFTFNPKGTGYCSAPFCAAGVTPDFTNINIGNTAPVGAGTSFSAVTGSATSLNFVDFEGGAASAGSSQIWQLSFNISSLTALGSSSKVIDISNVIYNTSSNGTGLYSCANGGVSGTFKCPTTTLTLVPTPPAKAPEINPASAASGLTLLFGILAVARGRRRFSQAWT
jgi:hypothetical protein